MANAAQTRARRPRSRPKARKGRWSSGKTREARIATQERPFCSVEGWLYVLGRHQMGQNPAQIAGDHNRTEEHVTQALAVIEELRPEWVLRCRYKRAIRDGFALRLRADDVDEDDADDEEEV